MRVQEKSKETPTVLPKFPMLIAHCRPSEGSYNASTPAAAPITAPIAANPACFLPLVVPLFLGVLLADPPALEEVEVGDKDTTV